MSTADTLTIPDVLHEQRRLREQMVAIENAIGAGIAGADPEAMSQAREVSRVLAALSAALGVPQDASSDPAAWAAALERTFAHWLAQRGRLELDDAVAEARAEMARIREDAEPLKGSLDAVGETLSQVTAALSQHRAQMGVVQEEVDHLSGDVTALQGRLAAFQERLDVLQGIADSLKAAVASSRGTG